MQAEKTTHAVLSDARNWDLWAMLQSVLYMSPIIMPAPNLRPLHHSWWRVFGKSLSLRIGG